MIDNKLEQIKQYMINNKENQGCYENVCSKEQIERIDNYELNLINDIVNLHERICWLISLDNLINFEINKIKNESKGKDLIDDYINGLDNRKNEVIKIVKRLIPKYVDEVKFIRVY
ncbi:hypothetical protein [Terrisporobacter muris]|uniref:Uncharacterized protein n=1 Tax=Terrisporobacter muris TaxID=2963284 RepID=A0A9X2MDL8_9FIRM|nr:hypothetical protein [Terrisporobacter muris]MCR1823902.1 hypothetical protein [Terrisporobacter muris]